MQNESKKISNKLKVSAFLLALGVITITTATYAWFSIMTSGNVNELSMQVTTGEKLGISTTHETDISKYSNTLTTEQIDRALINSYAYNTGTGDIKLAPLTSGNGISLYTRGVNLAGLINGTSGAASYADKNYLELDLWFMGTTDMYVYMTAKDSVTGALDGTAIIQDGARNSQKQSYVPQAARLSLAPFYDAAGTNLNTEQGILIYEPHKAGNVFLNGKASVDAKGNVQTTFDLNSDKFLFRLPPLTPVKVTVRLWIEGEDEQCVNTDDINIENAWLKVRLRFVAKDKNGIELN